MIRSLSRALAILALGALASGAQGAELFRRGDVSVELSGSIRGIGVLTRGTGHEDYQAAVQGSLVRLGCESSLLHPNCPFLQFVSAPESLEALTGIDFATLQALVLAFLPGVCPGGALTPGCIGTLLRNPATANLLAGFGDARLLALLQSSQGPGSFLGGAVSPELADLLEEMNPDFARGLVGSAVDPICFLAESFEECPAFHEVGRLRVWQSLVRVRTRLDVQISPSLSGRIEYDHEVVGGRLDTLEAQEFGGLESDPLLPFQEDLWNFGLGADSRGVWRHELYRGWLRWETDRTRMILGRQRIPWGVGRLWNPIDRFNPISPLAIEQSESTGIDAVLATWFAADAVALDVVYAPGDDWDDPSYALRLHGLVLDTDYSLMAGVFDDANTIGATMERNLGDMAFHVEAVYANPDARVWPVGRSRPRDLSSFWQVVVSLDTNIDLGKGIYALIEHLYNGNALGLGRGRAGSLLPFFEATMTPPEELPALLRVAFPGPYVQPIGADRFGGSRVVTLARHQTGGMLGYDLTPTLRGDLLVIYDWNGHSSAIAPQFSYTPRGDLEFTLGLQFFTGRRASQYGQVEDLAFLTIEYFF